MQTAVPMPAIARSIVIGGTTPCGSARGRDADANLASTLQVQRRVEVTPTTFQWSFSSCAPEFDASCCLGGCDGAGLARPAAQAETMCGTAFRWRIFPDKRPAGSGAGAYSSAPYTFMIRWSPGRWTCRIGPAKLVPGLATEWKVDDADKTKWRFSCGRA